MGITGLLPFLKSCSRNIEIKTFKGYTAAIDAYCWIHRSAYSCAMDLALGNPTDQFVKYCMRYLQMVLDAQVKPILVFDGENLPSKAGTDAKRRESKKAQRDKAAQFLLEGNRKSAQECFERSVDVTPMMAHAVMQAARDLGVDCIVAPYESDAQLAYLAQAGYADLIITEDSDLLIFGCSQVIFKLDITGHGVLITWSAGIGEQCCRIPAKDFSVASLRYMGIMSGCDYFPGIPRIGLATSAKIMSQCGRVADFRTLLEKLGQYFNLPEVAREGNEEEEEEEKENESNVLSASFTVSSTKDMTPKSNKSKFSMERSSSSSVSSRPNRLAPSIIEAAVRAERTFRLQVVFDPRTRQRRRLTEASPIDLAEAREREKEPFFAYAGNDAVDPTLALDMALGNVDVHTFKEVDTFSPDNFKVKTILHGNLTHKTSNGQSRINFLSDQSPLNHSSSSFILGGGGDSPIEASQQPDSRRANLSIWQPDYPVQPVWLHFSEGGQTKPFCVTVTPNSSPLLTTTSMSELKKQPNQKPIRLSLSESGFARSHRSHKVQIPSTAVLSAFRGRKREAVENEPLDQSIKISKVLDCYSSINENDVKALASPLPYYGASETPISSTSDYFTSPVSAACAPPNPIFNLQQQHTKLTSSISTLNPFATKPSSPIFKQQHQPLRTSPSMVNPLTSSNPTQPIRSPRRNSLRPVSPESPSFLFHHIEASEQITKTHPFTDMPQVCELNCNQDSSVPGEVDLTTPPPPQRSPVFRADGRNKIKSPRLERTANSTITSFFSKWQFKSTKKSGR